MIQPGERIPESTLFETLEFGDACPMPPQPVNVTEALKGKRVVIFGLPGAFTPTCSGKHLPGYVENIDALRKKGVDELWCVSVNDGAVMAAWGREQRAIGKVRMLGDGAAELTTKLGLEVNIPGMGVRMRRCSLLVEDGVVKRLNLEEPRAFAASSAETMLEQLG
jgi:glutaredoxin/glutathione-dependent peroxiredoxin